MNLVEIDAAGQCKVECIPLTARRDVRFVEGALAEILSRKNEVGSRDDFVKVRLSDKGAILDVRGKLQDVYPNVMIERLAAPLESNSLASKVDRTSSDVAALFAAFYQEVTGQQLTSEQAAIFSSVVDKVRQQEREA